MPTLEFKGKPFVYAHHLSVPFRELVIDESKSLPGDDGTSLDDNLIIHGDNLEALKALLPKYAGKVDCIFIDPPYNTGNEGWCYNDNVNSPLMKQWLEATVKGQSVDGEDLERHDKWACMMWPRLKLLWELLSDDGAIFVCNDDNEHPRLRMMLDEIFGAGNFISNFIWHSHGHTDNQYDVKITHEYITAYAKSKEDCVLGAVVDPNTRESSNLWKGFAENSITKNGPANPPSEVILLPGFPCSEDQLEIEPTKISAEFFSDTSEMGFISRDITRKYSVSYPVIFDKVTVENSKLVNECKVFSGWANVKKLKQFMSNGMNPIIEKDGSELSFYISKNGVIYYRRVRENAKNIVSVLQNFSTTETARSDLEKVGIQFQYPKPVDLVTYVLKAAGTPKDAIVLDSFAGSGTTGHAVRRLNREDGGNRKFVLIECSDYSDTKTAQRMRLVANGELDAEPPLFHNGALSFTFCELGEPMDMARFFDGANPPALDQVARYIAYTATGGTLDAVTYSAEDHFIGEAGGYRLHLIYNPDAAFMRSDAAMLDMPMAEAIAARAKGSTKPVLVFAAGKYMSQKALTEMGITFCQLPYAIHKMLPGDGTGD